ncbi:MAG: hypothetical protein FWF86_02425, partial [Clostridia bacterium]|nr:hypothetical protein [Clostridia bacterium]
MPGDAKTIPGNEEKHGWFEYNSRSIGKWDKEKVEMQPVLNQKYHGYTLIAGCGRLGANLANTLS